MSTTNVIGRKITGFEFPDGTDGIHFHKNMGARIGEAGEITYVCDRFVTITFDSDGILWNYPTSLIEQHLVPESGGEKPKGPWQVIERSGQIADTGDYVGEAELTDGKIHLYCTTEFDCEADEETPLHTVANILNESKADLWVDFMRDDPDAMDLLQRSVNAEAYRVENQRLRAALEKIANWELPETGETSYNGHPLSYEACYGSNGARDYMRQLARTTLSQNT